MFYRIVLFIHISAVIVWIGTGIAFQALAEQAVSRRDEVRIRSLVGLGDSFGPAFFGVLTALVLLSGLALVFDGGWGFEHVFIIGGLIGIVASGALGGAVIGPTGGRFAEAVSTSGPTSPEAGSHLVRLRNAGRLDLLIMTVVVFLMTVKPGL